jgi:anti-sigma regulatory factor (Ser/Thr protein kinase)
MLTTPHAMPGADTSWSCIVSAEGVRVTRRSPPPGALADGEAPLSIHGLDLEPDPRAPGLARQFVREHVPNLPAETEDSLLLLTSELVSNAVLHARTPIRLDVVVTERSVTVAVHDLDLAVPLQDPYASSREGGWGLELVAALADASATTSDDDGKTAWFRLSRGDAPAVGDGAAARTDSARRDS